MGGSVVNFLKGIKVLAEMAAEAWSDTGHLAKVLAKNHTKYTSTYCFTWLCYLEYGLGSVQTLTKQKLSKLNTVRRRSKRQSETI